MAFLSIVVTLAGIGANVVVVRANGGKMPVVVRPEYRQEIEHFIYRSEKHCLANEKTKYLWLSDRYYQIVDGHVAVIYSIGDVLIWSGNWACNITTPILALLILMVLLKNTGKNVKRFNAGDP
jgi:hypothetical protein